MANKSQQKIASRYGWPVMQNVWKMQVYTRKLTSGGPEKNRMGGVLYVTGTDGARYHM